MTNTFDSKDVADNKGLAAVSYLSILSFIPFIAAKSSPFAQFHAKQGIALFLIEVAWMIIFNPLVLVFLPFLNIIFILSWIALVVVSIVGIVKALQGEAWEIPLVSNVVKLIKL